MEEINKNIIENLLKHNQILLEKTILLSEDLITKGGEDRRLKLNISNYEERQKIINDILKESEQIRKNSATVLSNIIQILELY